MENSIAQYEIRDTLLLNNKIHLLGSILRGNFDDGDFIIFKKDNLIFKRKILGVGTISNLERKLMIRLTIQCKNKIEKESLSA